ncbi:unnamed protein product [Auanema sp. JU1783]|nr:unnamed protein product [Auanema sp. JU1783]
MLENSGREGFNPITLKLREELSSLPYSSAAEFFAGLKNIANQYEERSSTLETELAFIQQTLPEKLDELGLLKQTLLNMRKEIVELRDGYMNEAKTILASLKQNVPFVVEKMESIAEKKEILRRLECLEEGNQLIAQCKRSIELKDLNESEKLFGLVLKQRTLIEKDTSETFENEFDDLKVLIRSFVESGMSSIFKKVGYPFENSVDLKPLDGEIDHLVKYISLLYRTHENTQAGTGIQIIYEKSFEPLRKRFLYFFYGERKTNNISKPQWYLSLALSWFQTCLPFFEHLHSVIGKKLTIDLEPSLYFFESVSNLVYDKTESLLYDEDLLRESYLFSHLIDECISYEEHKSEIDVCQLGRSLMDLLSRNDILKIWLTIEKDCCIAKIDDILLNPNRWKARYALLEDADQYCVCECAESFVSLIQGLQQRSRLLNEENAKRQFVDLQLILVDDFRQRLVQIARQAESPWAEPYPQVMNALWYLRDVLEEWNETALLAGALPQEQQRHVFNISREFFEHVWGQMADDVVTSLHVQCGGLVKGYQQQKWSSMESRLSHMERELSAAFCPLLMKVRTSFSNVGFHYSKVSVQNLFKRMTSIIGRSFVEDVISQTSFNAEGAAQMLHDIEKGLLPALNFVFSRCAIEGFRAEYDKNITILLSSLRVLSLSYAVATLLREEIGNSPDETVEEKLASLNVYNLNKANVELLLKQRSDLVNITKFGLNFN